ncbi:MAG TPA: hypothetical protein VHC69_28705 [Polyangiaceae bacterium]|nr:hypothetical protein [Polyangiaceae bacterium]
MTRALLVALFVSGALCAAGCKKSAETTAASASASASASAAPAPAPASTGIPTSEDFEQQALDEINPQNMEQELEKLEKDIEQR